jgi:hypothetical protein
MNQMRVFLGSIASLGLGLAVACSSSSSSNSGGDGGGSSGGASSGSSSGASSGDGSTDVTCTGGQQLCIGITGNSCVAPGAMCLGTTVFANQCASSSDCASGQVCCSSYADGDGGIVYYLDGGTATPAGVTVQCLSQCPTNAASSEVCTLDADGASTTTCPDGTTCRDFTLALLAPKGIPNTLCLPPLPDGGGFFFPDGGFTRPQRDGGAGTGDDAGAPAADAASE